MAPRRVSSGPVAFLGRAWQTTHAPEYVGLVILIAGWLALALFVTPFHRMFFINDLHIAYPHAVHERVSVPWLFIYAFFIPLGVLILYNLTARSPIVKHEVTYLSFFISIVLTLFLTDVVKNAVGRPRPDLLDRCHPSPGTKENVLVTIEVCTAGESHKLQDGWRSFPSGHSSFSFAGLGFLSLFLAGQLHIFHHPIGGRDLGRALICLSPLVAATLIAISRCEDYRHDVYDVCVGSVLGMSVAYWSYRRHWPRLSIARCHEPYPRPGADLQSAAWQRVRDEEEGGPAMDDEYELQPQRPSRG
ncbi:PAP2 superfamily protein [Metarhizium robertsii]|uniref:PAP2 superfamily protein n=1 Tax=Metarhizium robertsii TaxID=568076 RepID=A0A0A1V6P4_9HYPO|nr:PAP2 superfamily protein [Metarhizium robertsii]